MELDIIEQTQLCEESSTASVKLGNVSQYKHYYTSFQMLPPVRNWSEIWRITLWPKTGRGRCYSTGNNTSQSKSNQRKINNSYPQNALQHSTWVNVPSYLHPLHFGTALWTASKTKTNEVLFMIDECDIITIIYNILLYCHSLTPQFISDF